MTVGIALGVNRKRVADFFVEINGGSDRNRAVNRFIFGTGIPLMALMFTAFGLIFEIYGWVGAVGLGAADSARIRFWAVGLWSTLTACYWRIEAAL